MVPSDRSGTHSHDRWNIIVVVSDTLRTAFIGCYGNEWIHTPNIDAFAAESALFENAHPESLPTIPMRRSIHTGRRAYPFASYNPVSWDNVYIPGWQPMDRNESTVAETLAANDYHTGFYADVPHYFVPGMNFTRGFLQWEYIRGQTEDRYRSRVRADDRLSSRYAPPGLSTPFHLVNLKPSSPEEEWPTARTFRSAIRFLQENADNRPFYLYVDTFSPHETWEAPLHYYNLYGAPEKREPIPITMPYGPLSKNPEVLELLPSLRANYSGLVTMVDRWFGELLHTLETLNLQKDTMVIFTSDHGTNFADNTDKITGKPPAYLYPGTMDVPLIVRLPDGTGSGKRIPDLVYTLDLTATVAAAAKIQGNIELDGRDLFPLLSGTPGWQARTYLTCRYENHVWYKDDEFYFYSDIDFTNPHLFRRSRDPMCEENIAGSASEGVSRAKESILADAGGILKKYVRSGMTDAIGRPIVDVKEIGNGPNPVE